MVCQPQGWSQHLVTTARPGETAGRSRHHTRGGLPPGRGRWPQRPCSDASRGHRPSSHSSPPRLLPDSRRRRGTRDSTTAGPAAGPVSESGRGWGTRDEDPQLRAARTDRVSVSFISCHLQADTPRCCSGDLRAQRRSAERMRPSGRQAAPSPRWTLQGASWELPGVQKGGRWLLKIRLPARYSGRATLTLLRSNGAWGAQRRARGHTASQRPARPLIRFRFCQCLSLLCTDVSSARLKAVSVLESETPSKGKRRCCGRQQPWQPGSGPPRGHLLLQGGGRRLPWDIISGQRDPLSSRFHVTVL